MNVENRFFYTLALDFTGLIGLSPELQLKSFYLSVYPLVVNYLSEVDIVQSMLL